MMSTSFSHFHTLFILCGAILRGVKTLQMSIEMQYTSSLPSFPPLLSFHFFPPEWTGGKGFILCVCVCFFPTSFHLGLFSVRIVVTDNFRGISFYACNSGTQRLFPPRLFSLERWVGTARIKKTPRAGLCCTFHICQVAVFCCDSSCCFLELF